MTSSPDQKAVAQLLTSGRAKPCMKLDSTLLGGSSSLSAVRQFLKQDKSALFPPLPAGCGEAVAVEAAGEQGVGANIGASGIVMPGQQSAAPV